MLAEACSNPFANSLTVHPSHCTDTKDHEPPGMLPWNP
jgi:hypothetical protein